MGSGPEGADDLCLVSFKALGLTFSINDGIDAVICVSAVIRGGHTRVFLEIPYGTLESGGLLSVEKDRKKIGYPTLEEK